jgi:hypothetical protein
MRSAGHVRRVREVASVSKILVGNSEEKIQHRRPRHKWEDFMKIVMNMENMDWI